MTTIKLQKGQWSFNEGTAPSFDSHVEKSIPMYHEFHKEISELAYWFVKQGSSVIDMGSSTGKVYRELSPLLEQRKAQYIGYDVAKDMVDLCNQEKYSNAEFIHRDVTELESFPRVSLATAVFSLQFIDLEHRLSVLKNMYEALTLDGALIITEKVLSTYSQISDIFNDRYQDFKFETLDAEDMLLKKQSLRGVMSPLTLEENCGMLKVVGFKKIDVFMKWNNFAGIVAIK